MKTNEFLYTLGERLENFPKAEKMRILAYYEELIADYMEDGLSETEAIARLGDIDSIVRDSYQEQSIPNLIKMNVQEKKRRSKMNKSTKWYYYIPLFPFVIPIIGIMFGLVFGAFGLIFGLGFGIISLVFTLIGAFFSLLSTNFLAAIMALGAALFLGGFLQALVPNAKKGLHFIVDKTKLGFQIIKQKLLESLGAYDEE